MASSIGLLYVGAVLLLNGISMIKSYSSKSTAIMNFFTGGVYVVVNCMTLAYAIFHNGTTQDYFNIATSMLFGFTYLFVGLTNWYNLETQTQSWFCFFVGCNAAVCTYLSFNSGDIKYGVLWGLWGLLWLLYWYTGIFKTKITAKHVGYITVAYAIGTCWIPGMLELIP